MISLDTILMCKGEDKWEFYKEAREKHFLSSVYFKIRLEYMHVVYRRDFKLQVFYGLNLLNKMHKTKKQMNKKKVLDCRPRNILTAGLSQKDVCSLVTVYWEWKKQQIT